MSHEPDVEAWKVSVLERVVRRRRRPPIHSSPAVFGADSNAEQPETGGLLEELSGVLPGVFPFVGVRCDLVEAETLYRRAEQFVLLAE